MVAAPLRAPADLEAWADQLERQKNAFAARARDGDARADAAAAAHEQAQIVATLLRLRLARWQYAGFSPGIFFKT